VTVADACLALDLIERQLRPLFEPPPVVDLCHATSNGLAVLPGLGAYWTYGTPLIISEHGIYLRERYLSINAFTYSRPVRSILLSFFKHLTWAGYQVAKAMAPGSEYNVLWLEANGCDPVASVRSTTASTRRTSFAVVPIPTFRRSRGSVASTR